jgi:hypothetical protein
MGIIITIIIIAFIFFVVLGRGGGKTTAQVVNTAAVVKAQAPHVAKAAGRTVKTQTPKVTSTVVHATTAGASSVAEVGAKNAARAYRGIRIGSAVAKITAAQVGVAAKAGVQTFKDNYDANRAK